MITRNITKISRFFVEIITIFMFNLLNLLLRLLSIRGLLLSLLVTEIVDRFWNLEVCGEELDILSIDRFCGKFILFLLLSLLENRCDSVIELHSIDLMALIRYLLGINALF